MTHRTFTASDQLLFAALSGDFNPMHVDPVHARRLMFGAPVVHGIHTLLWALDTWSGRSSRSFALLSVKATFAKPVRVGQEIEFSVRKEADRKARLVIRSEDEMAVRIDIEFTDTPDSDDGAVPARTFQPTSPVERQSYEGCSGELPLLLDMNLAADLLPNLASRLLPSQIAVLLASTRLVGMEYPGQHSIYSELELSFSGTVDTSPLAWAVEQVDERFALVAMRLFSPGVSGHIRAFVRPQPRRQQDYDSIRALVPTTEFMGQRALVVGGSRGLGEVTAKLLAAGGAEVMITYHQGSQDAETLVAEIKAGGGVAACAPFNVLAASVDRHETLVAWAPTHLYYFATPFIATGREDSFSQALFEKFCSYYVSGFLHTVALFGAPLQGALTPSSIFVEERPDTLREYAAAKAATEYVCIDLAGRRGADFRLRWPRLPKMNTDQTASLAGDTESDPTPVMLYHLRDLARPKAGE